MKRGKKGDVYSEKRFKTPVATVKWAQLHAPDETGKYSLALYFPKSENIKELIAEVNAVGAEAFGNGVKFRSPFINGDTKDDEALHGMVVINAKTSMQPEVVKVTGGAHEGILYAGSKVKAIITPASYDFQGKGVKFFLGNVLVLEASEKPARSITEDFEELTQGVVDEIFGE